MNVQLGGSENFSGAIQKDQIQRLHTHYKENTGKRSNKEEGFRAFDENRDTRYVWFSLAEVLRFLMQNGVDVTTPGLDLRPYGLRLYFAQHDLAVYQPVPRDPETMVEDYNNKDTIIIVLTANEADQLIDEQSAGITTLTTGGTGLDNSKLCPPECSRGSVII